jgi:hypothetical protein
MNVGCITETVFTPEFSDSLNKKRFFFCTKVWENFFYVLEVLHKSDLIVEWLKAQ